MYVFVVVVLFVDLYGCVDCDGGFVERICVEFSI